MEETRINKFLSEAGVASRREADRLIERNLVKIRRNGEEFTASAGDRVLPGDEVFLRGEKIEKKQSRVYILYNKPAGIVCTGKKDDKSNILKEINYPGYITYVGRLDKESTGIILLTDDGELNNRLSKAVFKHEKEYLCEVDHPITKEFLERMRNGVPILDTVTRKCKVTQVSEKQFRIVLTQGLNRQIRRMCGALGYGVRSLQRIRIQNLEIGDLAEGTWRYLTAQEVKALRESCGLYDSGK